MGIYQTTCRRFDCLTAMCWDMGFGAANRDDGLLYMLTDPNVIQAITAQHVVMRPRQNVAVMYRVGC